MEEKEPKNYGQTKKVEKGWLVSNIAHNLRGNQLRDISK